MESLHPLFYILSSRFDTSIIYSYTFRGFQHFSVNFTRLNFKVLAFSCSWQLADILCKKKLLSFYVSNQKGVEGSVKYCQKMTRVEHVGGEVEGGGERGWRLQPSLADIICKKSQRDTSRQNILPCSRISIDF